LIVLIALSCPSQIGTAVRIRIGESILGAQNLVFRQNEHNAQNCFAND
jgi:hypothetical protein